MTPNADDAGAAGFRRAERALWDHYELQPSERFIDLAAPEARIRVQEVGAGPPILLVHGSGPPGAGSVWAPLVRELEGYRCLMPDLPGAGLSSAVSYAATPPWRVLPDALIGVLDALGLQTVNVIGWSIGGVWSMRLAQRHASRVERIAIMGWSPLLTGFRIPRVIRLQGTPIGALMERLPVNDAAVRSLLRRMVGHGASLDAGRIPDELIGWIVALMRETDTPRNDRLLAGSAIGWDGPRPGLTFEPEELAAIGQPALYVAGTDDWDRILELARRVVDLLPSARLHTVRDGGHVPWLDDPAGIGAELRAFLSDGTG
ncbi:MAG: alpha/beta fold hydrolase [Candidatus Limnocylindria bacterium]